MTLLESLRHLQDLSNKIQPQPPDGSYQPNVSIRVDADMVFWVEVDSDLVAGFKGHLLEEASTEEEVMGVIAEFSDTLNDLLDSLDGEE